MTLPDLDKVVQELNRRFSLPLPEFYVRRIIFWYDEEREFEDKNAEMELQDARIIQLTEMNNFEIKKLLTTEDKVNNYCVYCPVQCPDEENWLLPIQLYSEEFRADLISMWLEEMQMENTASIRKVVKDYRGFFKSKAHRTKVAALNQNITAPVQIHKAVMAVLCGVKDTRLNLLIRTVLCAGTDTEKNGIYQSFVKYNARDVFWQMATQLSGGIGKMSLISTDLPAMFS